MLPRKFLMLFPTQLPLDRLLFFWNNWTQYLLCFFQEFDEDELEAELDALGDELELEEQEELDKQLLDVGPAVGLPEVPTAEPAKPASVPARVRFYS